MRVYLAGAVAIEGPVLLTQRALGTPQAVVLFARLTAEPHTLVSREALAEAIWADDPPESLDTALSALASRLRAALRPVGIDLATMHGAHQVRLPDGAWIDLVAADSAADEAEGLLRANRNREAWAAANVAVAIARRGFLPDHRSAWVGRRRSRLRTTLRRGLHILGEVSARTGEATLAAEYGETLVSLDPFRETGYRQLMRAHAAAGNRAEALRVYARLRELLRDELGTSPSAETEAVYLSILQA
jgi:SARP family transcriptional regulator, regulator of embCAB operon